MTPTTWAKSTLGEVAEIVSGATPKTSVDDYWDGDIPWVTPKDLSTLDGMFIDATPRTLSESGLRSCSASLLPANSVLLSSRAPIGLLAINTKPMATNQGFKSLIPDKSRVDARFLYRWLEHNRLRIQTMGTGATFKEINKKTTSSIEIMLPPLEEQKRIAAILDAADQLRTKSQQVTNKIEVLKLAIFNAMFGHPAQNDCLWTTKTFEELCPTHLGKMLDQKQQTGEHLRPYLRNANVRWFHFDLADCAEMDFDNEERKRYRLEAGDVLICEGGEAGRAAVWNAEVEEVYFQKALHRGKPNPELATGEFLVYLLKSLAEHGSLNDKISTATIGHLTGKRLKSMVVIAPPIEDQKRFSDRIAAANRLHHQSVVTNLNLDQLFNSLQQRAFRGDL